MLCLEHKIQDRLADKAALIENEFKVALRQLQPSLDVPHLARAGWSACISLTEDILFETALRTHLDSVAGTRPLTIVDQVRVSPPSRSIPVYKLLGNVQSVDAEGTLVMSEAELQVRQQDWRALLQSFPDFVMEAPVFVLGTATSLALVRNVLGALSVMPKPRPTKLLFLRDDPALADAIIVGLCRHFSTETVDGSLRDLCAALQRLKAPAMSVSQPGTTTPLSVQQVITKYSGLVGLVPNAPPAQQHLRTDMPSLLDGLFRPAAENWLPFQLRLDLRRTVTDEVIAAVRGHLNSATPKNPEFLLVRGEAGIGKTTLLKRAAVELAEGGIVCLWCNRILGGNWARSYRALSIDLAQWAIKQPEKPALVVFCDDPWALRLEAGELIASFDQYPGVVTFVFSLRNSEYGTDDFNGGSIGFVPHDEVSVPYELDASELDRLGQMLVKIGATKDIASAKSEVARVPSRHSRDILCSLWYLVPETRTQLAGSLSDEYCRLGSPKESVSGIAEVARADGGAIAHSAYEFVTVTSSLNIGLPLEVLVHALDVNYSDWLETVGAGRPLWGLLYDEKDEREDTYSYYTRNEVVTRVLLDLVNGGVGHAGEFRVLKRLISACGGGSLLYRNFVLDILIRSRDKLSKFLTYQQGLELFEAARAALPYEDRIIEHHRGIWMRDVGHLDEEAYKQFERALQTNVYPGSDRDAPREHIHTSMAASIVRLIKTQKQDAVSGSAQVREHLRQATNSRIFNAHNSHVSASLLFELAKIDQAGLQSESSFTNLVGALQEIEKARQIMGSAGGKNFRNRKDLELMRELEGRMLAAIPADAKLQEIAENLFKRNSNQVGFEVCARRLLVEASFSSKGKQFNEVNDFLNHCMDVIEAKGVLPTPDLLIVRVDLMIRWHVLRFTSVPWQELREDLADILADPRYRDDVIKHFYHAVALYHLGNITDANASFATLRRWQPSAFGARDIRCFYLAGDGNPRRFQGTYKKEALSHYFMIPELNVSVPSRGMPPRGAGAVDHAFLAFTLNGPLALDDRPDKNDLILP